MKKILLLSAFQLFNFLAFCQSDGYTMLSDSNGVSLPGFYFQATNIVGVIPVNAMPTNWLSFQTFSNGTNNVATNTAAQMASVSNVLAAANIFNTNWVTTNLAASINTASNVLSTNFLTQLAATSNFLSTNILTQLTTASNTLAASLTNSITTTSNGLSIVFNYNLNIVSNALQTQIGVLNGVVNAATNVLSAAITTTSNALQTQITTVSNIISTVSATKAFTATLPANYASIGIGFSTPLMPNANYSVSLTPQDWQTAQAPLSGLTWYVGSKTSSGFTIYVPFATNAYNLNFDCQVQLNTQ
jgi:hypothetical protein